MTDRLGIERAVQPPGRFQLSATETTGWFVDDKGRMTRRPTDLAGPARRIDNAAVFSALQFGAIVPPLSPWVGVRRLLPGFRYRGLTCEGPVALPAPRPMHASDSEERSNTVCALLDRILEAIIGDGPDPVVLFSGGVDSGLIASRLAALGRKDTLLLNFSFGDDDREAQLAREMASQLGLLFKSVRSNRGLCDVLEAPGQVYSEPFADPSTVPTADLAHTVSAYLASENRPILDGTGADGAFGLTAKATLWQRVLLIPAPARRLASMIYATLLWHRESKWEYQCRILRRSVTMPILSAAIAQNPLAGILYKTNHAQTAHCYLEDWIGRWAGRSITRRIVGADLALVCANIFAQKSQAIYENAGLEIHYPFLNPDLVAFAMSSVEGWPKEEPKAVLRRLLARHVPDAMVFRPKSGFSDPENKIYYNKEFISHLRAAIEPSGPINLSLHRQQVLKCCDFLGRGKALPIQTHYCLWAIAFINRWYRTAT